MTGALSAHAQQVLAGDVRASARLMRWVDDDRPEAHALLAELFPHTGKARIIGLTGNPGAGKSTLVNALIHHLRRAGKTVGCVAVDPTSPFSGGAILGDRVRMQQHALDRGVFIRSVATRGNLGGISRSTPAIVQILDAMGFDVILIETVGVGQDEVDIVRLADTSVVLQVPGLGDDIQASKAGILEIADILVINKADNPASKRLRRELTAMLELDEDRSPDRWQIPVIDTVASEDQGIDKLLEGITAHLEWLDRTGKRAEIERARQAHYIHLIALGQLEARLRAAMRAPAWSAVLDGVCARRATPAAAAGALLAEISRP